MTYSDFLTLTQASSITIPQLQVKGLQSIPQKSVGRILHENVSQLPGNCVQTRTNNSETVQITFPSQEGLNEESNDEGMRGELRAYYILCFCACTFSIFYNIGLTLFFIEN